MLVSCLRVKKKETLPVCHPPRNITISFRLAIGLPFGLVIANLFAQGIVVGSQDTKDQEPRITVSISAAKERYQIGEEIRLHVEIRNAGKQDVFVFKDITTTINALAHVDIRVSNKDEMDKWFRGTTSDSFSSNRASYPPLANELSKYWVALAPQHCYGGDLTISAKAFDSLSVPGKYQLKATYRSRGFFANDVNNPLLGYTEELKQLPYKPWTGEVETNSIWIEVVDHKK